MIIDNVMADVVPGMLIQHWDPCDDDGPGSTDINDLGLLVAVGENESETRTMMLVLHVRPHPQFIAYSWIDDLSEMRNNCIRQGGVIDNGGSLTRFM